tara:strand:+ start:1751 stop:1936 length:186 start_codon:yes stop_codon:yes gene_type:complete
MILDFPDMKSEKLTADAVTELSEWVQKYSEAGITDATLIGLLEAHSAAISYSLLIDEDEDE